MKHGLNQLGDTIIEVMIAMAIIGLTLAVSFSIARQSQSIILGSEERNQMLRIAEQQVERLKQYVATAHSAPSPSNFCIISTSTGLLTKNITSGLNDANCSVDKNGNYCIENTSIPSCTPALSAYPYNSLIISNNNEYHIFVSRDSTTSSTPQVVNLQFRIYP